MSLLLPAILAFLLPIAIYCWVLAAINRRSKPTIVSGFWDCVGLLLAAGGIFLVVGPVLINRFFYTLMDTLPLDEETEPAFAELTRERWYVWAVYFVFTISAACLVLWWRRNKTVIYNINPEMFEHALRKSLDNLNLTVARTGSRLLIEPKASVIGNNAADNGASAGVRQSAPDGQGELIVELFPSMYNVSLHWLRTEGNLRSALEARLADGLEEAKVYDNPAANWFMGLTGLLFGLVFLTGMVWVLTLYFPRRW